MRSRTQNTPVMLDSDLAELYGVATKNLNKAVRRNLARFPSDFMFQRSNQEVSLHELMNPQQTKAIGFNAPVSSNRTP